MADRIYLWDNLKVLLMMLVVMTHSANIYQLEGYEWIQYLWVFIMTFTMPLFMIISGFWYKPRSISYSLQHFLYPCLLFSAVNLCGGAICGAYPDGVVLTKSGWAMWYIWALLLYNVITPLLLNKLGNTKTLALSILLAVICGFRFLDNNILDAQRVVNFYPYFLIGICLRKQELRIYSLNKKNKFIRSSSFFILIIVYLILCYYRNGFCYGTGFMQIHGFSIVGFISKWLNFILCLLLSASVMMIIPNRKLWVSSYGSRTMNVYMLHMSIIFPLCWRLMRPIMNEWYGYLLYIFVVPFVCSFLFSEKVDMFMKPILALPNKIFTKRNGQI